MSAVEAAPPPPRPPRPMAPPTIVKKKAENNFKSGFSMDLESIDFGEFVRVCTRTLQGNMASDW